MAVLSIAFPSGEPQVGVEVSLYGEVKTQSGVQRDLGRQGRHQLPAQKRGSQEEEETGVILTLNFTVKCL